MAAANGFEFQTRKNGDVAISHHHRVVTLLRGSKATKFLERVADATVQAQQDLMARATGNYKRGNERLS